MDEDDEVEPPLKSEEKGRQQALAIFENDLEEISTTLKTVKEKAFYKYLNKEERQYIKIVEPAPLIKIEEPANESNKMRENIIFLNMKLKEEEDENARIKELFQKNLKEQERKL